MKKLMGILLAICVICLALAGINQELNSKAKKATNKTLTIYNWGDYIDPELINKFEKQTGYHVIYETFDSNEAMLTKIKQGGTSYDIAVPSDYMITRMQRAHLLDRLDQTKLPNLKNIDPRFMHLSFDPQNNYSVPYFWGTLGIIYNDKFVKREEVNHWNKLWNPKFKNNIMLVDSARDVLAIALITQNHNVNSINDNDLIYAQNKLNQLTPNVKAVVADEIKMYMVQNEAAIAVTYSGEAREMMDQNSHLHYIVPSEGSNIWFDNLVIPKTATHKKAAYQFLNFMLDAKNAAQNAKYIGYATPNQQALHHMPKNIVTDRQFYPDKKTTENLQVYRDLPLESLNKYNDIFLQFKMFKK